MCPKKISNRVACPRVPCQRSTRRTQRHWDALKREILRVMANKKICYSLSTVACLAIVWLASIEFFSLEMLTFSIKDHRKKVDIVNAGDNTHVEDKVKRAGVPIFAKQRLWTVGEDITFHVSLMALGADFR